MGGAVTDNLVRLAGAYIAYETHINNHYCKASTGEGRCDVGDELLRRLHTAYAVVEEDERAMSLEAVREWLWEENPLYPKDEGHA